MCRYVGWLLIAAVYHLPSGHEDEPIALFDLVFGLCVGTVAFPYWIFGALVSGFRSSFGRKAA